MRLEWYQLLTYLRHSRRPPGVEDDEAPPGVEAPVAAPSVTHPPPSGGHTAESAAASQTGTDTDATGDAEAPPPPPPPRKEPTIIHVPLKVPEGARKKQVSSSSKFEVRSVELD